MSISVRRFFIQQRTTHFENCPLLKFYLYLYYKLLYNCKYYKVQNEQRRAHPKDRMNAFSLAAQTFYDTIEDEARCNTIGNAVA